MTIIVNPLVANVPALAQPNYTDGGLSFLDMVKRLHQESGSSGAAPTTTISQKGDIKRLVDWVSSAWMDIQAERRDWFFMLQPVEFTTVAGKRLYSAVESGVTSFGNFKLDSFRQYRASVGFGSEMDIYHMPYDAFRNRFLRSTMRTQIGMPIAFAVDPSKNFLLGPIPDDAFIVNGEGYAMPTEMSLDTDRPTMPPQYHMAVVWKALQYYGTYEAAAESLARAEKSYKDVMAGLYADQLPSVEMGGALA